MADLNGIISLLIACLEILFVINIFIFSKRSRVDLTVAAIILLLLVYQTFEFAICNLNLSSSTMIYFAFADLTLLPPTAIALVTYFYSYRLEYRILAFVPALFWIVYYFMIIPQFEVVKCTMLYAAYNYPHGFWYGLFYYGEILIALIIVVININKVQKPEVKRQTYILLFGLLSFTIPMIIAYFLYPLITEVVESVMCKFAFLFAVTLTYFSLEGRKRNEVT